MKKDSRFEPKREKFSPLTIERIREVESKLGSPLPKAYVAFLSEYGACLFSGDATVPYQDGVLPIFTFFGDGEEDIVGILDVYEDFAADRKLPIARDMAGNIYVLDPEKGTVFFVDYSTNPCTATKVSDSFEGFLDAISVTPYSDA